MSKLLVPFICLVVIILGNQLGPRFGFEPSYRILDSVSIQTNKYAYLVQVRNDSFFEAYTIGLLFVEDTNTVSAAQLGFKESYWWLGKLRSKEGTEEITISTFGSEYAVFHPESKSVDVKPSFGGRTWHLVPTGSAIALSLARNKSVHGYPVPPDW